MARKKKETPNKEKEEIQNDVAVETDTAPEENVEEVIELSKEEELEIQIQELKDKHLRLFAEFDNYKKRTNKERLQLISTAGKKTITSILPVIDDFDRAYAASVDENSQDAMSDGMVNIYKKLQKALENQGVKEMESNNELFDSEYHEAITEIPAPTEDMKGKVMDTVEKGYFINDTILRFAKVVVGK